MENKTFYNEILTEHNLHPYHKHKLEDANLVLEGVNPSCGDDIFLELKVEDGVVVDGAFERRLCHFPGFRGHDAGAGHWQKQGGSVASGRPVPQDDQGKYYEEERDELEEASVLQDIAHMPARVKCAVLGWHTMQELLKTEEK